MVVPQPTKWKLTKLKEHPEQATMFGDMPDTELKALVDNIRRNGLRHPIECLPDGTIISGHQRVRAAKLLGWKEIDVIVRHDLAKDPKAAAALFVSDNLDRRHLSPLAKARAIQHLLEIESGTRLDQLQFEKKEAMKQAIADRMGLSLRSINRYLLVIATPPEVQTAFDAGHLSLSLAGKVALLPERVQAQIAKRIAAGETPSQVVASSLHGGAANNKVDAAFGRLIRTIRREMPQLKDQFASLRPGRIERCRDDLQAAAKLLLEMAKQA
ncbi:MAG: ParB N-terminal domain-containing protein [Gemmataceae bacterium]